MGCDLADLAALVAARLDLESDRLADEWKVSGNGIARHFVIDDLLPAEMAASVAARFPVDQTLWHQRDSFRERKKTFAKLDSIDPLILAITESFHTADVVAAIARITGLAELKPDPELYAGGISMMGQGDFLNPHIDNSHDKSRSRYRRLNLLYYVSPDWLEGNGGNLELWDDGVRRPTTITAAYNRLIVMETNRKSWHSVSPVVIDRQRCCVSNYYFSETSPEGADYYHVTSFMGRPGQQVTRLVGRIDNWLRQKAATGLGLNRGKRLGRYS